MNDAGPLLRIAHDATVAFASDLHLSGQAPATAQRALQALTRHASGRAHLFLLGDVFEMWVGDDSREVLAEPLAQRLADLSRNGTHVWLMRGNRDFLLDVPFAQSSVSAFSTRCGAQLLPDPCVIELHGRRTVLTHGDALCTDDVVYQQWRATCRHAAWQQAMLARPLAERELLGRQAREHSEAGKREQSDSIMDVNADAVDRLMTEADVSLMIHGHTHRPAVHRWDSNGQARTRVVLPDWHAEPDRGYVLGWEAGQPVILDERAG